MITKEQYDESLKLINSALNKSCLKGMFTLDDAFLVKNILNNIDDSTQYNIIWNELDKSCKNGIYSLDEAYIIKIAMNNVENYNKNM